MIVQHGVFGFVELERPIECERFCVGVGERVVGFFSMAFERDRFFRFGCRRTGERIWNPLIRVNVVGEVLVALGLNVFAEVNRLLWMRREVAPDETVARGRIGRAERRRAKETGRK